jgi:hypothetical protein
MQCLMMTAASMYTSCMTVPVGVFLCDPQVKLGHASHAMQSSSAQHRLAQALAAAAAAATGLAAVDRAGAIAWAAGLGAMGGCLLMDG